MATVVTLNSPDEVLDYLNSITLPVEWEVIDKGARYTAIDEVGAQAFTVVTFHDEAKLLAALPSATDLKTVVPKREGGKFTFISVSDVAGGSNSYLMEIVKDQQELEDFLNTAITVLKIIEHDSKKLVIYT